MNALSISLFAVLLLTLAGCGEKATGNKPETVAPSVATKSDARADMIKSLEARVAQSDADAQLLLAKTLLDGSVTPPDYERAKGLLVSASEKGLPEAILGLYLLRVQKAINDDRLPKAETLRDQALATHDPFVTLFLFHPYLNPVGPPDLVVKLADSGHPLANAKMASYYGDIASGVGYCRRMAATNKVLKMRQSVSESDRCSRLSRIPDSFKRAIAYAMKILDAKEVDADKVRYWTFFARRLRDSKSTVSVSSMSPLSQMKIDHVLRKADPYFSVFADALSQAGRILKDDNGGAPNYNQTAQILWRAAEPGHGAAADRAESRHVPVSNCRA